MDVARHYDEHARVETALAPSEFVPVGTRRSLSYQLSRQHGSSLEDAASRVSTGGLGERERARLQK